jgi:hypothetical protein
MNNDRTNSDSPQMKLKAQVFSFQNHLKQRKEDLVYTRWVSFYKKQEHQDLLDALVYEHENNFPLRSSEDVLEQLRHKALVEVLQERAYTNFLKSYLDDLRKN